MKEQFEALGATIVAITPQLPEYSETMVDENRLGFDLLTDHGSAFANEMGLRFALPDDLKKVYQKFGIDLEKHNDETNWTLPMPARIIVDQGGIVRDINVDPDYTIRPEPEDTLALLKNM